MRTLLAVLMVLALAFSVSADLLSAWNVAGINASTTPVFTNTTSAANITSNSCVLRLGAGVTASGTADTFGGTSWGALDYAGAVSANEYISWLVQADVGYQLSITNINFNFERSATGTSNIVVQSSFDGFTANLFASNDIDNTTFAPSFAVSLSGSNSVELRLYGWNAGSGVGVTRFRNLAGNDLAVQGTVIPEPASMALIGLGAIAVWIRRRFMA